MPNRSPKTNRWCKFLPDCSVKIFLTKHKKHFTFLNNTRYNISGACFVFSAVFPASSEVKTIKIFESLFLKARVMNKFLLIESIAKNTIIGIVLVLLLISAGCAVEAAKQSDGEKVEPQPKSAAKIEITQNSPADTVRVFYHNLREKHWRDAIFLSNLRPAVEGLTEPEMADLQLDFAALAGEIPTDIEINGEVVSGDKAAVTARLPDNKTGAMEVQTINLRREGDFWIILLVDETAESAIKKQGNKYFANLKIETHHAEVEDMMERVAKAEMFYATQNGGSYGDLRQLVGAGLLSDDLLKPAAGYNYKIAVGDGGKIYRAAAEPEIYGKTGKLSFLLKMDGKSNPKLTNEDRQGKSLLD